MKYIFFSILLSLLPMAAWPFTGMDKVGDIWYNINTKAKTAEVTKKSTYGQYSGDVVIPSSIEYEGVECVVNSIAKDAFYYCDKLTSVLIPNSVTYIGSCAFQSCDKLTSITIPESVITIESGAFSSCYKLSKVNLSSVSSIGANAFESCKSLTSIVIPESVKTINPNAFHGCANLDSVIISDIGAWCNIQFTGRAGSAVLNQYSFYKTYRLFKGEYEVKDLIIPEGLKTIHSFTFSNCKSITTITFPASLEQIGMNSFENCEGIREVVISENITKIAADAFWKCANLNKVILPTTLKSIGSLAFAECTELSDVYCYATECPDANNRAFQNSDVKYATLHVPASSLELYKSTSPWNEFGNIVALTEEDETGISAATEEPTEQKQFFSLDGKRICNPQKGVNIVRMPNGRTKKEMIK